MHGTPLTKTRNACAEPWPPRCATSACAIYTGIDFITTVGMNSISHIQYLNSYFYFIIWLYLGFLFNLECEVILTAFDFTAQRITMFIFTYSSLLGFTQIFTHKRISLLILLRKDFQFVFL